MSSNFSSGSWLESIVTQAIKDIGMEEHMKICGSTKCPLHIWRIMVYEGVRQRPQNICVYLTNTYPKEIECRVELALANALKNRGLESAHIQMEMNIDEHN